MNGPPADRLARLRDRATTDLPEAWRPTEPGDVLAGELVRYEQGHTDYGPQHIAIIRDEDAVEHAFWLLHAVALDEFKKLRPAPGELVAICFLGPRTSATGQPYTGYRVVVDRQVEPPQAPDAGAVVPDPEEPPF